MKDWYDEDSEPARFSTTALMQEILLSYRLLVLFDRRARGSFDKVASRIRRLDDFDSELDELCLGSPPRRGPWGRFLFKPEGLRETFRASSDFPIFSARLLKIEEFIDSVQPTRIASLWRDRRDILRWYTF